MTRVASLIVVNGSACSFAPGTSRGHGSVPSANTSQSQAIRCPSSSITAEGGGGDDVNEMEADDPVVVVVSLCLSIYISISISTAVTLPWTKEMARELRRSEAKVGATSASEAVSVRRS